MARRFQVSPAAQVAAFYCLLSCAWILGSDQVATALFGADPATLAKVQTYKGLGFVATLTVFLYVLVVRLHRVQERNRQIEAMLRVSERLDTLGSLAATLVHDLNNMLAVIRGFTDLAKWEHGQAGLVPPGRLSDIEGAVVRANNMVRQLSLFLQRGQDAATRLDPAQVLRELKPLLAQAATPLVELELQIRDPLPELEIERGLLEQALMNLVVNARDAMAKCSRRELKILAEGCQLQRYRSRHQPQPVSGEYLRIQISDTGCGIAPQHLLQIFTPFFTTKPPGEGTGLGLPSVLRMAQQHGGWVEVRSQVGEGTQFILFLAVRSSR